MDANHRTLTDEDFAIKASQPAELDAPSAELDAVDFRRMRDWMRDSAREFACMNRELNHLHDNQ